MIETFERPKIECVNVTNKHGTFVIEPLERGFGTTIGNSLRRVLLSSLPGVAVTSIKIDGVMHEFTTIPGVKEDVTEIILNLKQLSAKIYVDMPKILTINAIGPCEVTAADISPDADVEIVNPELHIATLNENGRLNMELTLEKGRGYVLADKNKRPGMAIDREVFSCHPPKIEPMVRQIIDDFRNNRRDEVPVWMEKGGSTMLVKYMAVRDKSGAYLGTVELVQNMEFAKTFFLGENK